MKKLSLARAAALGLAACMVVGLAGCGPKKDPEIDLSDRGEQVEDGGVYIEDETSGDPDTDPIVGLGQPSDSPEVPGLAVDSIGPDGYDWSKVPPSGVGAYVEIMDRLRTEHPGENLSFSPLSLDMALAMVGNGADSYARDAVSAYLGRPVEDYNETAKSLVNDGSKAVKLANALFMDKAYAPAPAFRDLLSEYYSAGFGAYDFSTRDAVDAVNRWCNEKTEGLIPVLVDDLGGCDGVLLNALYFKADWTDAIEDSDVSEEDFTCADGSVVRKDMLHFDVDGHIENDAADGFVKYYDGGRYCFVGILPKAEGDFDFADVGMEDFVGLEKFDYDADTYVVMPEFKFDNTLPLTAILKDIGLHYIFADGQLTGIFEGGTGHVSDVLQKTVVDVNRKGTEAAAVTGVFVKNDAMAMPGESYTMEMDRPFAFLILDREADQVLFMGKVAF